MKRFFLRLERDMGPALLELVGMLTLKVNQDTSVKAGRLEILPNLIRGGAFVASSILIA